MNPVASSAAVGRVTREHVLDSWRRTVVEHADQPSLFYFGRSWTFAEIDEASSCCAAGLRSLGVAPNDRVAIVLQNMPQFVVTLLATWKAGAIAVPLNPMYRSAEFSHALNNSGAVVVVAIDSCIPHLRSAETKTSPVIVGVRTEDWSSGNLTVWDRVDVAEGAHSSDVHFDDLLSRGRLETSAFTTDALLTYTSGTTGDSKAVVNTHDNVSFAASNVCEWFQLSDHDRILAIAPLFHITGLIAYLAAAMQSGSAVVLTFRFDPAGATRVARELSASCTVAPITAFIALLQQPGVLRGDLSSLSRVASGGAPVAGAVVDRFVAATGTYIHNAYGLTEATSVCTYVPFGLIAPIDPRSGALSVGKQVPGTDVAIRDTHSGRLCRDGTVGEIVVRGDHLCRRYWNNSEATQRAFVDGWFLTGDLGMRDDNGWIYVVDRLKDLINASGYKVSPREVEDVLAAHPAVHEASVVGVPDAYRGETVAAFVVLRPDRRADADELIAFVRNRLAAYKSPRVVTFVDELPRTTSGKVLRRVLRNEAAALVTSEGD